jgi:hypothetical protein
MREHRAKPGDRHRLAHLAGALGRSGRVWFRARETTALPCVRGRLREALPSTLAGRRRLAVLTVAVAVAALKLHIAATTAGTNDVFNYRAFANGVRRFGPIEIYGEWLAQAPYNHPPLTGWMLASINWLTDHGMSFAFLIRTPATLADLVTAVLVFELIRARRPLREATVAGLVVSLSPILVIISGFHGNTDPVFVMFAMLSLYLLVTGRSGILAGLCAAVAVSVKLVPVVVLPLLVLVAWRAGRRRLPGFLAGGAAVIALLWLPVVVNRWTEFKRNVLGYAGYGERPRWGLPEFAYAAGLPPGLQAMLVGPGRFVVLLIAAGVPLVIAWWRPALTTLAFGMALTVMLLLTTATATQYLAWAAAAVLLVNVWAGMIYNVVGGALLVVVYSRWNRAPPWNWDRARAGPFTSQETIMAGFAWLSLLTVIVVGLWSVHESIAGRRCLPREADAASHPARRRMQTHQRHTRR